MKRYYGALILVIILSLAAGVFTLITPSVVRSEDHFSAERCAEDIKYISQEVHSVFYPEALQKVRDYLVDRLEELRLNPIVMTYEDVEDEIVGAPITINNIYAKTEGDYSSYILLVAHYDSSPKKRTGEDDNSRGAADDGYGLSTILELMRVLNRETASQAKVNGIKVLFTDGEETGLHGAKFAVLEPEVMENVSLVINVEARGIKGPAIMFETSANNSNLIKLFKKGFMPFSYSFASDIYRQMPNFTDLTPFMEAGYNGMNIAVLDNLDYYHTGMDNYTNINLGSIQHYGEQLYPMIKDFVLSSDYSSANWSNSESDLTFFTLLPGIFITYNSVVSYILLAVAVLLCILLALQLMDERKLKYAFRWILKWLLYTVIFAAVAFGVTFLISKITGIPFNLTYMPKVGGDNFILIGMLLIQIITFVVLAARDIARGITTAEILSAGAFLQLIMGIILTILLPGGAFLYVISCILSALAAIMLNFRVLHRLFAGIAIGFTILLFFPIIYLLNMALTIGAMSLVAILFGITLSILIPLSISFAVERS